MILDNFGDCISVELLDSDQVHALQSWTFESQEAIKIGRAEEQDVTIANPHVSRWHAELTSEIDGWCIKSLGRNGVLLNGEKIEQGRLSDRAIIRLGATGPVLRFSLGRASQQTGATMSEVSSEIGGLFIDESRKQQEVDEIVNNDFFQELKQRASTLRRDRDK